MNVWYRLLLVGCLGLPNALAAEVPLKERAYAGISMRDNPEGTVIARVCAGPFGHAGVESAELRRGDLVVSVNGSAVDTASYQSLIESLHPGDELTFAVRRNPKADPNAPLPKGDPEGELMKFSAPLGIADEWLGTLGRGGSEARGPAIKGEFEDRICDLSQRAAAWADDAGQPQLDGFLRYLSKVQTESHDSFALPSLVECFARPLSVDAAESQIANAVKEVANCPDSEHLQELIARILKPSSDAPPITETADVFCERAEKLVRHLRDSVSLEGPDAGALIATVRDAPAAFSRFVLKNDGWIVAADWEAKLRNAAREKAFPREELPSELQAAVEGDILFVQRLEDGRFAVVGGAGRNRYRMDTVEIVYDIGGDDVYDFFERRNAEGRVVSANHVIFDVSGDDQYLGHDDFVGPGVAVCGFSLIDDRAGNDLYRSSRQFSIAAGLFGVGIILDRAGNDRYENIGLDSGWSQGAGVYGAGLVIDQSGDDVYLAEKLSQGVGGPFAFGAIIDSKGNDSYKANGPSFPSGYGTPGVFLSMSQGFGIGIRDYASGGIGAIYDFAGDDRYDAGEFSQGCGYSFAIGIVHDYAGNDTYNGNRYSQAAAAHQAIGILLDDAGNDRYFGKTAASQSGAWDQSITLFVDRAGDDIYKADDLCQGAAAQQALALFLDLVGSDRYEAGGGVDQLRGHGASVQGASGPNEYHFQRDNVFSFSLLSDCGPGQNWFSSGRKGLLKTGFIDDSREHSHAFGVFSEEESSSRHP